MSGFLFKKPFLTLFLCLSFCSCWLSKQYKQDQKVLLINGAGASFPYILYSKWFSEYRNVDPSVAINYQSIGSGGGIRQFIMGTLDFGGTDVPVSKQEIESSKKKILHIPTTLGAVAITYNLDIDKSKSIRLNAEVLSQIFRGKIKTWNEPPIQELNPDITLPQKAIVVVYRADGSGTTSFFTNYLALLSKDFLKEVGKGKSVPWPVGVGGKGNEGVMSLVNKISGAIAYISASYAVSQGLSVAAIKNKAGYFVKPSLKSIQAAADQAMKDNKSYTSSLLNINGQHSYPLAGFTYIIISQKMSKKKGQAIIDFLKWALNQGQSRAEPLHFISLPGTVTESAMKTLSQVELE